MRMEQTEDTAEFIIPYSQEKHTAEMMKEDIFYLSVYDEGELAGFFILALGPEDNSVEFRRIVIANKSAGTGQAAMVEMEKFCRSRLNCKRIWLDVFESNRRGRHVYQKLGYALFKKGGYNGKPLCYYEKMLR